MKTEEWYQSAYFVKRDEVIKLQVELRLLAYKERVLREVLIKIRHDSKLWKPRNGVGGCDQYAGMPLMVRIIDEALIQKDKL